MVRAKSRVGPSATTAVPHYTGTARRRALLTTLERAQRRWRRAEGTAASWVSCAASLRGDSSGGRVGGGTEHR
eukprot:scaffold44040_cov69-Phaeocystis_antarctica.AAC.4